jgi:hypothetical protein
MNYLLAAYAFGIVVFAGYIVHLVRQTRLAAEQLREVDPDA